MKPIPLEKHTHLGHRDLLADLFRGRPFDVVRHEELETLVGRNYQQRISEARRELKMNIENVKRLDDWGKQLTGDYRYRPETLGREASTIVGDISQAPLFTGLHKGPYDR